MSLPTAVFLDTSIFDGQNYNYDSAALSGFMPALKDRKIKLLLPDPTRREIEKHIKLRVKEAVDTVVRLQRKTPFLSSFPSWPKFSTEQNLLDVTVFALKRWREFLGQFDVINLGYEVVNVDTLMNWYENAVPPFGVGAKSKEFPDALAVQCLLAYAHKTHGSIAVVSADGDFKLTCDKHSELLYFATLPKLTELLVLGDSKQRGLISVISSDTSLLEAAILAQAEKVAIYHSLDSYSVREQSVEKVHSPNVQVVGIGDDECTIVFEVPVDYKIELERKDWLDEEAEGESYFLRHETMSISELLTGKAKLKLSSDASRVVEVAFVHLDQPFAEIKGKRPVRYLVDRA